MKKFKYSKLLFFFQVILSLFCVYFFVHGVKLFHIDSDVFNHNDLLGFIAFFVILAPFIGEHLNRFVEFKNENVIFNSFRIEKKVRYFNIRYEDILSLDAVKIPLLGIYKVKVKAKNIPCIIPITWCMKRHNELFYNLCSYAKKHNPKVCIDSRLIKQLEKKGYKNDEQ